MSASALLGESSLSGPHIPERPEYPVRVNRRVGAELVTRLFFPVSPRTLERWPLPVRHVNGQAVIETDQLFAHARSLLAAAPEIMGGKGRAAA